MHEALAVYLRLANQDMIANDKNADDEDADFAEEMKDSILTDWAAVGVFKRFDDKVDQARVIVGDSGLLPSYAGGLYHDAANMSFS